MTLTMSVMCVSRPTSAVSRCDRSPSPVSVGVSTRCPAAVSRSATYRQHQPPCHAPWTRTKSVMRRILLLVSHSHARPVSRASLPVRATGPGQGLRYDASRGMGRAGRGIQHEPARSVGGAGVGGLDGPPGSVEVVYGIGADRGGKRRGGGDAELRLHHRTDHETETGVARLAGDGEAGVDPAALRELDVHDVPTLRVDRAAQVVDREHRLVEHDRRTPPVSYTHLRAHETGRNLVCRL